MTKNLLALLLALQKVTLDADTQYLLPQLGNKLEAISEKKHPSEQDWQNIQAKISDLLNRNPMLAQNYQHCLAQLQTWTDEDLGRILPEHEVITSLQSRRPATLGYAPGPFSPNEDELENIIVVVSQIILRDPNPAEMSKKLLLHSDHLASPPQTTKSSK